MSPSGHLCERNATVGGRFERTKPGALPGVREAPITIGDIGEFALIAAIEKTLSRDPGVLVGIGDDAALVGAADGRVVATADMLIEGRHFRREWSGPADIGGKGAARNLADIAAMGAAPTALLVSFAGPGDLEVSWVLELVAGIAAEAAAAGAVVAGGDTSGADVVMLAITALGDLGGAEPVLRSGARAGDVVAVAGTLGSAAAGLALLREGAAADQALEELIAAHRKPDPPYSAGPQAAAAGATAMIDISDGLIADLGHIATASGVRLELDMSAIAAEPVTRSGALERAAAVLGAGQDWRLWALTGGDDHALAATFPPASELPAGWTIIGQARAGHGVLVDGRSWNDAGGWEHFAT
jgi:thiamine-monophosphate kinase